MNVLNRVKFPENGPFYKDLPTFNFTNDIVDDITVETDSEYDSNLFGSVTPIVFYVNNLGYNIVNSSLRNKTIAPEVYKKIQGLVDEIKVNGKLYNTLTLIRGFKPWNDIKIGDIITDPGFMSKSNNAQFSEEFIDKKKNCCLCIVHYPYPTKQLILINEFLTFPGERFELADIGVYNSTITCYYLRMIPYNLWDNESMINYVNPQITKTWIDVIETAIITYQTGFYFELNNINFLFTNWYGQPFHKIGIHIQSGLPMTTAYLAYFTGKLNKMMYIPNLGKMLLAKNLTYTFINDDNEEITRNETPDLDFWKLLFNSKVKNVLISPNIESTPELIWKK